VDCAIKIETILEIVNAMIAHTKNKWNHKKWFKIKIALSNIYFHHDVSTSVQTDIKALEFMNHIKKFFTQINIQILHNANLMIKF
jgi:hypothetical protein